MDLELQNPNIDEIQRAIAQRTSIFFQYHRADGQVTTHSAVYPRQIVRKGDQYFLKAYCQITRDVRLFRLDRLRLLPLIEHRERRSESNPTYTVLGVILAIALLSYIIWTYSGGDPRGGWVIVTRVTDGDTIGVGRGWRYQKVRLIGVDAPETAHPEKPVEFLGLEASNFTQSQLLGKRIRLEFEVNKKYDRYGRLLAYVFLKNGTIFNEELIKRGYARVIAPSPFRRYRDFKRCESEAREAGVGIWKKKMNGAD